MQVIEGVASKVRHTSSVSGGGKDGSVSTSHISIFQLNKQQVQIASAHPSLVDENDSVSVAGKVKNGVLKAYAYKNTTTGASGDSGALNSFFFGLIAFIVSAFAFLTFSDPFFGFLPKIFSLIFACGGFAMLYQGLQISKAKKLIQSSS